MKNAYGSNYGGTTAFVGTNGMFVKNAYGSNYGENYADYDAYSDYYEDYYDNGYSYYDGSDLVRDYLHHYDYQVSDDCYYSSYYGGVICY